MIFEHYSFSTIREKAEEVRNLYWKKKTIPVNIDSIIEFGFNIEIQPLPGLKSELDIEGMLSNNLSIIYVDNNTFNDSRFEARLRFTLAHELGHCVLHRAFYEKVQFKSPQEWMDLMISLDENDLEWYEKHANEFAGRLLVPRDHLEKEIGIIKPKLTELKTIVLEKGIDESEIGAWIKSYVGKLLAPKFLVSAQTIETRLWREKITLI